MTTTPMLPFIFECDVSYCSIRSIMQQGGKPIAFISKVLARRHHKLPKYEKELVILAQLVKHWKPYLQGQFFVVPTAHYSLKFFLEQRGTNSPQKIWITKLMGFVFMVEYSIGRRILWLTALFPIWGGTHPSFTIQVSVGWFPGYTRWRYIVRHSTTTMA